MLDFRAGLRYRTCTTAKAFITYTGTIWIKFCKTLFKSVVQVQVFHIFAQAAVLSNCPPNNWYWEPFLKSDLMGGWLCCRWFYFEWLLVDKNLLDHPHLQLHFSSAAWGESYSRDGQVVNGKTSTFHLGTAVSLSWQDVKLILLLFKIILLVTFEMLLWTSCLKNKNALFCCASSILPDGKLQI